MSVRVNVDVVVVDVGGDFKGNHQEIGESIGRTIAQVLGGIEELPSAQVSHAASIRDMLRIVRMIRQYGFITDEIDFSVAGELIEGIQEMIAMFNAIDTKDLRTVGSFLDSILKVIDIMARSTSWEIDDRIVEVAKLVIGPGPLRVWAISMIQRLIDRDVSSRQDAGPLSAANLNLSTSWSDWFAFARLILSLIGALR